MTDTLATQVEQVVRQAGDLALRYFEQLSDLNVRKKSPRDLVTDADVAVEQYLLKHLSPLVPEAGFWGEETGQRNPQTLRWVVDPIDGTHSFVRGQVYWSISVALESEGQVQLGCVYGPKLGVFYLAERGQGAFCNGKLIHCSPVNQLSEAMVSTGFACLRAGLSENNLNRFCRIALATMGQRRFGSAALDLCMVATGQVDAYWEMELNLYDIAAGALILTEAGGELLDFSGQVALNPKEVLATNRHLSQELVALM